MRKLDEIAEEIASEAFKDGDNEPSVVELYDGYYGIYGAGSSSAYSYREPNPDFDKAYELLKSLIIKGLEEVKNDGKE